MNDMSANAKCTFRKEKIMVLSQINDKEKSFIETIKELFVSRFFASTHSVDALFILKLMV